MRTQICDINMFPPSPKVTSLVMENTSLKNNNKSMKVILGGITVIGLIILAYFIWDDYSKKQEVKLREV